jgi:hypothetical protein
MDQEQMRAYWRSAPAGRLCPWEQAKALALREVYKKLNDGEPPKLDWIAARVTKVGGGHPERGSLSEFFAKVDEDPDWFPGKHWVAREVREGSGRRILGGARARREW